MYKSSYARKIFYFIAIPLVLFSTNGKAGQPSDKDIVDGAITKYIGDVSVTSMRKKIFDGQVSGTGRASVVGEITLNSATYIPDANKIRKDLENIFPNAEDRKFFNSKTKFNINKYREFYRVENKNGDKFKFRMELNYVESVDGFAFRIISLEKGFTGLFASQFPRGAVLYDSQGYAKRIGVATSFRNQLLTARSNIINRIKTILGKEVVSQVFFLGRPVFGARASVSETIHSIS